MNQPIEDGVRQGRVSNRLMPVLNWQLRGDDSGPPLVAIFDQFQQVVAVLMTERREAKIIEEKELLITVV